MFKIIISSGGKNKEVGQCQDIDSVWKESTALQPAICRFMLSPSKEREGKISNKVVCLFVHVTVQNRKFSITGYKS